MARSLNKATLIGNLGSDPEIRTTGSGTKVAQFSLATSRSWKSASGEQQEKTEWHRVVLWNNKGSTLADIAEKYCKKGDKVYIEGSIEYRSWQDREGQTRYTTEITARELIMLSGRSDGSESSFSAPSKVAAAAGSGKGKESFEDFPEALDAEDDDRARRPPGDDVGRVVDAEPHPRETDETDERGEADEYSRAESGRQGGARDDHGADAVRDHAQHAVS